MRVPGFEYMNIPMIPSKHVNYHINIMYIQYIIVLGKKYFPSYMAYENQVREGLKYFDIHRTTIQFYVLSSKTSGSIPANKSRLPGQRI